RLRCVLPASQLDHVKAEFGLEMSSGIVLISDFVAVFLTELGVNHRYGSIHSQRMAGVVGGVVRQSSQCESVLVHILRFPDHRNHMIAAADVMDQVAKELAVERIIAHVLENRSSVSVSVGFAQLFFRSLRKALEQ